MPKVSAREIVGNSFKLKRDVRAYRGSPNSDSWLTWKKGRLTDPVYSWVERNGSVWWMFGRQQPVYFIKHDADALEPFAERGAAQYLSEDLGGDKMNGNFSLAGFGYDLPNFDNLIKIAGAAIALIVSLKVLSFFYD